MLVRTTWEKKTKGYLNLNSFNIYDVYIKDEPPAPDTLSGNNLFYVDSNPHTISKWK